MAKGTIDSLNFEVILRDEKFAAQVQKDIEIELNACGMTRSRNHRDRDGR